MNINTRKIDCEMWQDFFDQFSRGFKGHAVTVSMRGQDGRIHTVARHMPLTGITAEQKGSDIEIEVILGDSPEAHVTHVIPRPSHVHVMQIGDGRDNAMEIGSAEGLDVWIEWNADAALEQGFDPTAIHSDRDLVLTHSKQH